MVVHPAAVGARVTVLRSDVVPRPFADHFPDARVATLEGWGHGGSLFRSLCMNRLVARYLVDLKAADGVKCKPDLPPFTLALPSAGAAKPKAAAGNGLPTR
ncbi:alpha/beta hydrolase [Streptomyces sp. NPDC054866]